MCFGQAGQISLCRLFNFFGDKPLHLHMPESAVVVRVQNRVIIQTLITKTSTVH